MSTFLRFKSSTGRKALTPHTYKKRQSLSPALDVAYCPEDIHHVKTDIVFVGGIHASDQLSDSWFDRQSNVDWPSELLPRDVPDARVLVYHYNPNTEEYYNAAAERNLEWHSRKLLFDLARIRADTHTVSDLAFQENYTHTLYRRTETSYLWLKVQGVSSFNVL